MTAVKIIVVLLVIYIFLICPRIFKKADRSPLRGRHYAHRGLFDNESESPENSLPAFAKAVEAGYGIEFDVQLTKDDIPVVFHDATLKRMCGADGNVWDYTLEELQDMKLANSQEKIPTLAQALNVVDGRVPLIIEYKMDRPDVKVCELGNELLKDYKGVYCMESFHPFAVRWYRFKRPDIVRGQLCMDYWKDEIYKKKPGFWLLGLMLTNFLARPDFIAFKHSDAGNLSRKLCRLLGGLSVAWTIKSKEDYEKAKNQFDLFIFDSCRL